MDTDLDLAGTFSIVLRNPDNTLLDSALLDLGKTVEIHLGYGNDLTPALLGEIAAIEPSFPHRRAARRSASPATTSRTRCAATSPSPPRTRSCNDSADRGPDRGGERAGSGGGPDADSHRAEGLKYESDMAFLKARAQKYFFDVYVEWDRLHFQFPRPQLAAHVLEWGRNLSSFSPRISGAGHGRAAGGPRLQPGTGPGHLAAALAADFDVDDLVEKLGSAALDLLGSLARQGILQQTVKNPVDAAELAKSLLADLLEGMYEGSGSCVGIPDLAAGPVHRDPGRRAPVQRHLPGAQGHPPDRRQRLHAPTSRSPSAATPACSGCSVSN